MSQRITAAQLHSIELLSTDFATVEDQRNYRISLEREDLILKVVFNCDTQFGKTSTYWMTEHGRVFVPDEDNPGRTRPLRVEELPDHASNETCRRMTAA